MLKRGKILRDTSQGDGLLSIEGQQYPFRLEGVWKSDVSPKPDMVVEVAFGNANQVTSITALTETQLAKEQAELAMSAVKQQSAQLAYGMVERFGMPLLAAMALLIVGWFVLNTLSIQLSPRNSINLSFWQILAIVNAPDGVVQAVSAGRNGSNGGGIYSVVALLSLLGPLARFFWKDPRAHLGGALPLLCMALVAAMIYSGIHDSMKDEQMAALSLGGAQATAILKDMNDRLLAEMLKAITIGAGGYLSLLVSLYLAAKGVIQFLAAKA